MKRISVIALSLVMTLLWSGLPSVLSSISFAEDLKNPFNAQRQVVRNLELQATKSMYAAAPTCDDFELKFNALMSTVGMMMVKNQDTEIEQPTSTPAAKNEQKVPAQNKFQAETYDSKLKDKVMASLPTWGAAVSAKEYGLDPQLAQIIDNDEKLSASFTDVQHAAYSCRPFYTASYDAEVALTDAIGEWIALAQSIEKSNIGSFTIEANSMWLATNIRRATHKVMHTTIAEIENECPGDLFLDQSIPNLFQALAQSDVSLFHKSISKIISHSLCLDVRQSVALDRGLSLGGAGVIMAFGKLENKALGKRLLEAIIMAGAPILENNKPLGPTGLWVLTQSLLNKQLSSPDIWVLDKDSYLVNYGITVAERSSNKSAVFPICTEEAPPSQPPETPPPASSGASELPTSIESANSAAILKSAQFNTSMPAKDLKAATQSAEMGSDIIPIDPEDAPLAYGYTVKELKGLICPVSPSKINYVPITTVDKTLNKGLQAKFCYKVNTITDSYRGDHLGYANCSLPEMVQAGLVCKRELCANALPPTSLPYQGDEGEMPAGKAGVGCGFPTFSGLPHSCTSKGGVSNLFVHQTENQGCGKLGPLAGGEGDGTSHFYEFEPIEITGPAKSSSSGNSNATNEKTAKSPSESNRSKESKNNSGPQPEKSTNSWYTSNKPGDLKKETLYQAIPKPQPPKKKPIFPDNKDEWEKFVKPYKDKQEINSPEAFKAALKKLGELKSTYQGYKDIYDDECRSSSAKANCDSVKAAIEELYPIWRELDIAVSNAAYSHTFDPIDNEEDLQAILAHLYTMKNDPCGPSCDKKAADLEAYIRKSPAFKKFKTSVMKDSLTVLKNKKFKKALKEAREKLLGRPISDKAYDFSYNAMLNLFPESDPLKTDIHIILGKRFLAMGATDQDLKVSAFLPTIAANPEKTGGIKDGTVNILVHEFALHVVSEFLRQYGYDLKEKSGDGASKDHPDHSVGNVLQAMTGIDMGYGDPPTKIALAVIDAAEGGRTVTTTVPDYAGYKTYIGGSGSSGSSGKSASSGSKGSGSGSGGSGSGSGGGGNKSCGPDGCFGPCQLATMAALAQCDMDMGKPVLKVIPGGGLIAPEKPLNQDLLDWLNCGSTPPPSGVDVNDGWCFETNGVIHCYDVSYHVAGLDNDKCQNKKCDDGSSPSVDKTTGVCSCKPSGSGTVDPKAGFRGGPDYCQQVICAEESLDPCCKSGGMYRGLPGQGGGFKNRAITPKQLPTQQQRQKAFGREYIVYPSQESGTKK